MMLPETPIEGKQPEGEQTAKPVSSTAAQPSEDATTKAIRELQATVRALQSEKDKRFATVVDPLRAQVERLSEALGIPVEQVKKAQRQVALSELADAYIEESQSEPSSDGTGDGKDALAKLQDIEATLGLPANDSRVTDLRLKHGNDPVAFMKAGLALRDELAKAQKLTPAEQLPPSGNTTQPPETDAQKYARIFGGGGSPFSNIEALKKIGGGVGPIK